MFRLASASSSSSEPQSAARGVAVPGGNSSPGLSGSGDSSLAACTSCMLLVGGGKSLFTPLSGLTKYATVSAGSAAAGPGARGWALQKASTTSPLGRRPGAVSATDCTMLSDSVHVSDRPGAIRRAFLGNMGALHPAPTRRWLSSRKSRDSGAYARRWLRRAMAPAAAACGRGAQTRCLRLPCLSLARALAARSVVGLCALNFGSCQQIFCFF